MRHDRHYVDELVTPRSGEGFGVMVPVSRISSNRDQPRTNLGPLDDLVASIRTHGVLEPLLIRARPDGGHELISGERRFHAAMRAGLEEVPCIELELDDQQALEIALIENLQRKDLTAFEEAEGFSTLIDLYGYTHEQVAAAVGRSRVTVTEALRLLVIPPEVRDACRHADINAKSTLLEIARAGDAEAMLSLVQQLLEERISRAELRRRRREHEESGNQDRGTNPRPFVVRFKASESRPFGVSLSFRTETEPEPADVIEALQTLIRELRDGMEKDEA
ncbi:MAG: ParB/RepB/Spo0J family partition protein [Thermoanaerobaculales bacterium]|jgi:ParB family chromosome partitioning protein|nr:ParB/RepB/Spo0J family partition protein [Thermoanaerobaculales bacterium]